MSSFIGLIGRGVDKLQHQDHHPIPNKCMGSFVGLIGRGVDKLQHNYNDPIIVRICKVVTLIERRGDNMPYHQDRCP